MPRLNDLKTHESITCLIYGPSGSGKSFLVGSLGDRTLIVTPSNGIATYRSLLFKQMVGANPIIEVVDELPITQQAKGFDATEDVIDKYLKDHRTEIDTIVVEDATDFRRKSMLKALELNMKLNRSKTLESSRREEIVIPAVQDYGTEMNLTEAFIVKYTQICKSLNINFVMTAHERLDHAIPINMNGAPIIGAQPVLVSCRPGFTGQSFPEAVTGLFDNTWHTETKGANDRVWYQLRTQSDSVVSAKTRYGGLFPSVIEKFTRLDKLFEHIKTQTPLKN